MARRCSSASSRVHPARSVGIIATIRPRTPISGRLRTATDTGRAASKSPQPARCCHAGPAWRVRAARLTKALVRALGAAWPILMLPARTAAATACFDARAALRWQAKCRGSNAFPKVSDAPRNSLPANRHCATGVKRASVRAPHSMPDRQRGAVSQAKSFRVRRAAVGRSVRSVTRHSSAVTRHRGGRFFILPTTQQAAVAQTSPPQFFGSNSKN
jgi:hypothetical protein